MAEIVRLLFTQQMTCVACGAEADASCNCGKPYVPKKQRAVDAIAANPQKSDRAIAADIGVDHKTVGAARRELGGEDSPPEREGRDGKMYRTPRNSKSQGIDMPTAEEADEEWQRTIYDQACLLLERMADSTRQKFFAHIRRKYHEG